jgi:hypothetical protein
LGGESRQFNELHWHTACIDRDGVRCEWTLKIEKDSQGGKTTIRLIGHFQSEHVGELKKQLHHDGPLFILDLKEVTVVDVEVVRFFVESKADGVKIVHCSQYIRKWMARERRP